ncbi:MAG: hypothetical protein LBQ22_04595 [Bacteroidales bacterium]|jgi:hypothetical protein|nr:hypothetical protein [Bacteroidales bacterium]
MNFEERIDLLCEIGEELRNAGAGNADTSFPGYDRIFFSNPWFTEEFVKFSLSGWGKQLTRENLREWLDKYNISDKTFPEIILGIIMAGNIPLVGFHDFICGFITGINMKIKLSSKDELLMKWVIDKFYEKNSDLKNSISYTTEKITGYNTIIATGSNNTHRYFEYYFSGYPNILRKNRNSIAIITGKETTEELERLADDIFIYFGLGCRSISKLMLPQNYNFNDMGKAFQKYLYLLDHHKYANNFNYQYALIAMNVVEHINFHDLLLVERKELYSPVAVVNFEYYSDMEDIKKYIYLNNENIQCVTSSEKFSDNIVNIGDTQRPRLSEYADNIDTVEFILKLQK